MAKAVRPCAFSTRKAARSRVSSDLLPPAPTSGRTAESVSCGTSSSVPWSWPSTSTAALRISALASLAVSTAFSMRLAKNLSDSSSSSFSSFQSTTAAPRSFRSATAASDEFCALAHRRAATSSAMMAALYLASEPLGACLNLIEAASFMQRSGSTRCPRSVSRRFSRERSLRYSADCVHGSRFSSEATALPSSLATVWASDTFFLLASAPRAERGRLATPPPPPAARLVGGAAVAPPCRRP
mmetsp:Transcript_23955/g.64790  ORF Transcript_23955/g.64790 Transcript_23955/m.64790 type:complete len:242 (-) Transcript_23955:551-1276(-)